MKVAAVVAITALTFLGSCDGDSRLTREENLDCRHLLRVHGSIKLYELEVRALPPNLRTLLGNESNAPYLRKADLLTPSGQPIEYIVEPTQDAFHLIGEYIVLESPSLGKPMCMRKLEQSGR